MHDLEGMINHTRVIYGINSARISENNRALDHTVDQMNVIVGRLEYIHDEVRHSELAIMENRAALVLYCQQFAMSVEMVGACAELLSCSERHLHY